MTGCICHSLAVQTSFCRVRKIENNHASSVAEYRITSNLELESQRSQTDREIDYAPHSLDLDSRQSVFPAI